MKLLNSKAKFRKCADITIPEIFSRRLATGIRRVDRLVGDGFLPGSIFTLTGSPGSGKTTYADSLPATEVFHTDDFMHIGEFKEFPERMIDLLKGEAEYIVEGVQVARMLRTGHRQGTWIPDHVVMMQGGDLDNPMTATVTSALVDWVNESGREPHKIWRLEK